MSTSGIESNLAVANGQAAGEVLRFGLGMPSPEQLDLLERDRQGRLPMQAFSLIRKQGRPAGAKNKRQQDIANYFCQKFGDPLVAIGEIMTMDLADMAQLLREAQGGETKAKPIRAIDLLSLKVSMAFKAAEYVHGKQPVAIDIRGKADLVLIAPELFKAPGIDPAALQAAVNARGLGAIDVDNMSIVDADYEDVPGDDDAK